MPRARRHEGWYYDEASRTWNPSVTSVVGLLGGGQELMQWYGRLGTQEANRVRDEAADVGTHAHAVIRWILRGSPVDLARLEPGNKVRLAVADWAQWAYRHRLTPILSEQYVRHQDWGYAGTMDCYAWIRTCGLQRCCLGPSGVWRTEVLDWKSSKSLRRKEDLQPPAYAAVLLSEGYPVHGTRLLRIGGLDEDGELRKAQSRDLTGQERELHEHFRNLLAIFRWMKREPKEVPGDLRERRALPEPGALFLHEAVRPENAQDCPWGQIVRRPWWETSGIAIEAGRAGSVDNRGVSEREAVGI